MLLLTRDTSFGLDRNLTEIQDPLLAKMRKVSPLCVPFPWKSHPNACLNLSIPIIHPSCKNYARKLSTISKVFLVQFQKRVPCLAPACSNRGCLPSVLVVSHHTSHKANKSVDLTQGKESPRTNHSYWNLLNKDVFSKTDLLSRAFLFQKCISEGCEFQSQGKK